MKTGAVMLIIANVKLMSNEITCPLGEFRHKLAKEFNSSLDFSGNIDGREN